FFRIRVCSYYPFQRNWWAVVTNKRNKSIRILRLAASASALSLAACEFGLNSIPRVMGPTASGFWIEPGERWLRRGAPRRAPWFAWRSLYAALVQLPQPCLGRKECWPGSEARQRSADAPVPVVSARWSGPDAAAIQRRPV